MSEAVRVTGKKPITVRWVDHDKGDEDNPNVRPRLVARDIRKGGESIFAPTPPSLGVEDRAQSGLHACDGRRFQDMAAR